MGKDYFSRKQLSVPVLREFDCFFPAAISVLRALDVNFAKTHCAVVVGPKGPTGSVAGCW